MSRQTLLLEDDELVVIDHSSMMDDVRRVPFDRVRHVMASRHQAWGAMIASVLLGLLPGGIVVLAGAYQRVAAVVGIGACIAGIGLIGLAWSVYCGRTRVWIDREDSHRGFTSTAPPRRMQRFLDAMTRSIEAVQRRAWEERGAAGEPEPTAVAPPVSPDFAAPAAD